VATRWTTTLSSKVNLPHEIDVRALCGANLVTYPSKLRGIETLEVHHVGSKHRPGVRQRPVRGAPEELIVFSNCLDLYHKWPDSGERQYKRRPSKRRFDPSLRAGGRGRTCGGRGCESLYTRILKRLKRPFWMGARFCKGQALLPAVPNACVLSGPVNLT